jgi:hypothetical protein
MATASDERESAAKAPCHKIHVGSIVATIWEQVSKDGRTFYSTKVVRVYKNEHDQYVDSNNFLETQLLELGKAAELVHTWIIDRHAEERAERRG